MTKRIESDEPDLRTANEWAEAALREPCPACHARPGEACVAWFAEQRVAVPAPFTHQGRIRRVQRR